MAGAVPRSHPGVDVGPEAVFIWVVRLPVVDRLISYQRNPVRDGRGQGKEASNAMKNNSGVDAHMERRVITLTGAQQGWQLQGLCFSRAKVAAATCKSLANWFPAFHCDKKRCLMVAF